VESIEATSHPFVVRIWLEENAREARGARWRGHITHVPSGERQYLAKLDDIVQFMVPYLEEMGVRVSLARRAREWLRSWKARIAGEA
jgi:hypothetical protein